MHATRAFIFLSTRTFKVPSLKLVRARGWHALRPRHCNQPLLVRPFHYTRRRIPDGATRSSVKLPRGAVRSSELLRLFVHIPPAPAASRIKASPSSCAPAKLAHTAASELNASISHSRHFRFRRAPLKCFAVFARAQSPLALSQPFYPPCPATK